ncbi:hypothetical protein GCM10020367_05630 [Streptomyces sannanensis]|uniref:Uncharacterized protein n=1 Tax=Streptomyces sannanensis TaxID=285536 RepID=A0ABP6S531_9ACTN
MGASRPLYRVKAIAAGPRAGERPDRATPGQSQVDAYPGRWELWERKRAPRALPKTLQGPFANGP